MRTPNRLSRRSVLVALFALLLADDLRAAGWRPSRLEGGRIDSLAQEPGGGSLYAASLNGLVFASDDGGATWTRLSLESLGVGSSPDIEAATGALVATTVSGLRRSVDGGATWSHVSVGPPSRPLSVVRDVALPARLVLGTTRGLFRSDDSGASWAPFGGLEDGWGQPSSVRLVQSPSHPSRMYLARDHRVFRSEDRGSSWQELDAAELGFPLSIAVHPREPDTVFASASHGGIFRSLDGGLTWQEVDGSAASRVAFTATGALIAGVVEGIGLVRSGDGGESFQPAVLPYSPVGVSEILPIAGSAGGLLAATPAGVLGSSDDGVSWIESEAGLNAVIANDLAAAPGTPGSVYLTDATFRRSDDRGVTWTRLVPAEPPAFPSLLAVSPLSPSLIVVAAIDPQGTTTYRSTDSGHTWTEGVPLITTGFAATALAVDRFDDRRLVLGLWDSFAGGGLFLSDDAGASWRRIFQDPRDRLLFQPSSILAAGETLLAAYLFHGLTHEDERLSLIVRSTDGGETWSEVLREDDAGLPQLAADPVDPQIVYVGGFGLGLLRSTDGGATWQELGGFPTDEVFDLSTDASRGGIVHATADGLVYRSADAGDTWQALPPAPGGERFREVDSAADGTIYASTDRQVYALVPDGEACQGAHRICLTGDRFLLEVGWRDHQGNSGPGVAAPLTSDTGSFWFFDPENVELVVKVLDARSVNGRFWVFFGSLTDVEFHLTVTDRQTGEVRTYDNPARQMASVGDTAAFPISPASAGAPVQRRFSGVPLRVDAPSEGSCVAGATGLCLNDGRFRVSVEWQDFQGGEGLGQAVALPGIDDTGSFWFFDPANVELVVKVLDARVVNGHFWVFYGALTNVGYRLTVTDTATDRAVSYTNPSGTFGSRGDTAAFPE